MSGKKKPKEIEQKETPMERALKLSNDEVLARAISDLLKKSGDGVNNNRNELN